jgi:hypothetical protein
MDEKNSIMIPLKGFKVNGFRINLFYKEEEDPYLDTDLDMFDESFISYDFSIQYEFFDHDGNKVSKKQEVQLFQHLYQEGYLEFISEYLMDHIENIANKYPSRQDLMKSGGYADFIMHLSKAWREAWKKHMKDCIGENTL